MASFGGFGGGVVGGAVVKLVLDDSQFKSGLAAAKGETEAASSTMGKFGGAAKTAFTIAATGAVLFGKSSVQAFMESQKVTAELANTIAQMPQLAGETTQAFQEQATALQNLTGYQDEEILSADNVLARFKLTGDQIRKAIPIVLDYARATGTDVASAAQNIGKALLGNTRALKTVGIEFTATGNTARDFNTILGDLQAKIGGTASTFGKTMAGQLEIAKAKIDDLQEAIGGGLAPVLTVVASLVGNFVTDLQALPGPLQAIVLGLGAAALAVKAFGQSLIANPEVAVWIASIVVALEDLHIAVGILKGDTSEVQKFLEVASGADLGVDVLNRALGRTGAVAGEAARGMVQAGIAADNAGAFAKSSSAYFQNLAAAHRASAAASRDEFLAETTLAGGLVGVEAAASTVQKGEQDLAKLRQQGKQGTMEYKDAVLSQQQAVLSLAGAVQQYQADNAKSPATTASALRALEALGAKYGLTKGQVDALAASARGAITDINGIGSALNNLHDKDVHIHVITTYSSTGAPGSAGGQQG